MSRRTWAFIGLAVVAVGAYAAYRIWVTPLAGEPKATGEPAPGFELPDEGGRVVRMPDLLAGGSAIIVFYRGHW